LLRVKSVPGVHPIPPFGLILDSTGVGRAAVGISPDSLSVCVCVVYLSKHPPPPPPQQTAAERPAAPTHKVPGRPIPARDALLQKTSQGKKYRWGQLLCIPILTLPIQTFYQYLRLSSQEQKNHSPNTGARANNLLLVTRPPHRRAG